MSFKLLKNLNTLKCRSFSDLLIRNNKEIRTKITDSSGATLVEVIIGMVILAMLVAGLNAGVISLVNTNAASKEIAAASNFGSEKLEELRRGNYNDIEIQVGIREGMYIVNRYVTEIQLEHKSVRLEIKWPATIDNPKHTITLSTIIARP
jgi:Tfp pilus assembly protein PilV